MRTRRKTPNKVSINKSTHALFIINDIVALDCLSKWAIDNKGLTDNKGRNCRVIFYLSKLGSLSGFVLARLRTIVITMWVLYFVSCRESWRSGSVRCLILNSLSNQSKRLAASGQYRRQPAEQSLIAEGTGICIGEWLEIVFGRPHDVQRRVWWMKAEGCVRPGRTVPLWLLSYSIYPVSCPFIVVYLWL